MQFAGTSWHELNYIRQAVGFLVIHQKRKKYLYEIRQDLCPKLTVRQIYRISTMYWDDKYGTQSVSNEASDLNIYVSFLWQFNTELCWTAGCLCLNK
ncbi:hypothetical protein ACS0TY_017976 [Phlomoides rotata]